MNHDPLHIALAIPTWLNMITSKVPVVAGVAAPTSLKASEEASIVATHPRTMAEEEEEEALIFSRAIQTATINRIGKPRVSPDRLLPFQADKFRKTLHRHLFRGMAQH